jgi:DNA polymerase III subunit delta'
VLSRCRAIRFMALPETVVASLLMQRRELREDRAAVLAHVAGGSVGRALQLDDEGAADWVLDAVGKVASVPWTTATEALGLAEELGRGRERGETAGRLLGLFDALGVYYRDVAAGAWREGWDQALGGGGRKDDAGAALACFELLDSARQALELHCNPQITMESLFMKMRAATKGRSAR